MVIHLASAHKFTGSPSDIQLVGGDTLTVPDNPRSVNVLGQVYNPTALTFRPGFSVAQYLDEVGGPTRDADTSEMFIVRADGTVYSRNQAGHGDEVGRPEPPLDHRRLQYRRPLPRRQYPRPREGRDIGRVEEHQGHLPDHLPDGAWGSGRRLILRRQVTRDEGRGTRKGKSRNA